MTAPTTAADNRATILLEQFEGDLRPALIEFYKSLAELDSDIAMFVARKSLCLLDVLKIAGGDMMDAEVLSDRFLDCDLGHLAGKKVTLIDDTLILGTSLAKTRNRLEHAGAKVETNVFCRNLNTAGDNPILTPDRVWVDLDERRTRTFCASEVRAFSLAPRPYLVDFPLFRPVEISRDVLGLLLTSIEWNANTITSTIQGQRGVEVYSFFPTQALAEEFAQGLGRGIADLVDIIKVRAFCRSTEFGWDARLVPLVTLKPLRADDVSGLLASLLAGLLPEDPVAQHQVLNHIQTPEGQQRLIQWLLSVAWGHRFFSAFPDPVVDNARLDMDEARRHYGPEILDPLERAAENARWIWDQGDPLLDGHRVPTSALPAAPKQLASSILNRNPDKQPPRAELDGDVLITDFLRVFLDMYQDLEIPARKRARELGTEILNAEPGDRDLLDRLETGLAWSSIVDFFAARYGDEPSAEARNAFSLVLDICNDLGVAVPVTAACEGVVFRAWRHGEDVLFGDQEIGLAHSAFAGALLGSNRESVPRLWTEKLLVLLIQVGLAKNFLEPVLWDGLSSPQARIAFDLKGAVPKILPSPQSRATRERWLSTYLVERGVLREGDRGGLYELGNGIDTSDDAIDAAYIRSDAQVDAKIVGFHLGLLLRAADGQHDCAPLDDRALIVLATCWPPRNVAGAIQAEVYIFREWLNRSARELRGLDLTTGPPNQEQYLAWRRAKGREALFSSRMKFLAHERGEHSELVERCATYLEDPSSGAGPMDAAIWRSSWHTISSGVPVQETRQVSEALSPAMDLIYALAAASAVADIAVEATLARGTRRRAAFARSCDLALAIRTEMEEMGYENQRATRIFKRVEEIAEQGPEAFEPAAAWDFALSEMEQLRPECNRVIDTLDPILSEFGRIATRHIYEYVVWYDVVDSMGNRRASRAEETATFREDELPGFRKLINTRLLDLTDQARQRGDRIHCWNGAVTSGDDQKHIYISGEGGLNWIGAVIGELTHCVEAFPGVRVRAVAAPCRFSGGSAYQMGDNPEVAGKSFIEYFTRLTKAVREISLAVCADSSYLAVVGDLNTTDLGFPEHMAFTPEEELQSVPILSGGTELTVEFRGGTLGQRPTPDGESRNPNG